MSETPQTLVALAYAAAFVCLSKGVEFLIGRFQTARNARDELRMDLSQQIERRQKAEEKNLALYNEISTLQTRVAELELKVRTGQGRHVEELARELQKTRDDLEAEQSVRRLEPDFREKYAAARLRWERETVETRKRAEAAEKEAEMLRGELRRMKRAKGRD